MILIRSTIQLFGGKGNEQQNLREALDTAAGCSSSSFHSQRAESATEEDKDNRTIGQPLRGEIQQLHPFSFDVLMILMGCTICYKETRDKMTNLQKTQKGDCKMVQDLPENAYDLVNGDLDIMDTLDQTILGHVGHKSTYQVYLKGGYLL